MKIIKIFFVGICVLSFCGCFFSRSPKVVSQSPSSHGVSGKIIKEREFKNGGTLVVLPFKAGVNASASAHLDRVSLMVAKGIIDFLIEEKTSFVVLPTDDQGEPDLVIEGYIDQFIRAGSRKRWFFQKRSSSLKVSGQVLLAKTNEKLFVFEYAQSAQDSKKDGLDLAYAMGRAIGGFLKNAAEENTDGDEQ